MSGSTEATAAREKEMKKNLEKRTPERVKEQDERHWANQKINIAGERQHLREFTE